MTTENINVREKVEERIAFYENTKKMIRHPAQGMERKGYYLDNGQYVRFSENEIEAAEDQCDDMIDFYLDLLEEM